MKPSLFLITPFSPARAAYEDPATFAAVQAAVAQAAALAGMELRHPARWGRGLTTAAGQIIPRALSTRLSQLRHGVDPGHG